MNWNLYHFRSRIKLTRSWSSDQDVVPASPGPFEDIQAWKERISLEFNDCGVSHPVSHSDRKHSVLTLDSTVILRVEHKECVADFTGLLEFIYATQGEPDTSASEVIQRIFYDNGFCGGQFEILPERDHAHDACPSEEAAFIRAAIDYANDSYLQPSETAFSNYLDPEQP